MHNKELAAESETIDLIDAIDREVGIPTETELCWEQHDQESIKAHQAGLEEAHAFFGDNGASEWTAYTVVSPRLEAVTRRIIKIHRIARARFVAEAKRTGLFESRTKPRLPEKLRERLFSGEILHNLDHYRLSRAEQLRLKENKRRACEARVGRRLASA